MTYSIFLSILFASYIIADYFQLRQVKKQTQKDISNLRQEVFASIDNSLDGKLKELIKEYMAKDEGMAILYSIISTRAKFLYFLANKTIENPQKLEYWLKQEQDNVVELLSSQWKDVTKQEIQELVDNFYKA